MTSEQRNTRALKSELNERKLMDRDRIVTAAFTRKGFPAVFPRQLAGFTLRSVAGLKPHYRVVTAPTDKTIFPPSAFR